MRRRLELLETSAIPPNGLVLAWLAIIPFAVLVLIAWFGGPEWQDLAKGGTRFWGGSLLLFFSGVRRGLSFRTVCGPTRRQFVSFLALFCAGLAALATPVTFALPIVAVAFVALALEERRAARHGEVPIYFARLRSPQMLAAATLVSACALAS